MEDEGAAVRGSDDELRCVLLVEPTGHLEANNVKWLEHRKLKTFEGVKGNTLTMFVEKVSVKKAYFELSSETMKFAFPELGPLEGVKSCSKVLVGEQLPTSGFIWKAAGLRLAYVAQHAFTTLRSTYRRRRRGTSRGALRITTTRRASSSSPMSLPSMRSPPVW